MSKSALPQRSLVGYWPLVDDERDYSGCGRHGVVRGRVQPGQTFADATSHIEIPTGLIDETITPAFDLGTGDFTITATVKVGAADWGVIGDVLGQWDPVRRLGFTLCINGTAGGYNTHGSQRNVHFGMDNGDACTWEDCGRPNPTSNYVSNSLTVFDGSLYAATTDGASPDDWAHVYRYLGGTQWQDCGRVGNRKTRGVGPMVVYGGELYAAQWSYDWVRVETDDLDFCRVYQYRGGTTWDDCGQPGECRRLFSIASYAGRLYVAGDDKRVYVYEGDRQWRVSHRFDAFVHPMAVHAGKLYVGVFGGELEGGFRKTEVFSFDGSRWQSVGPPMRDEDREDQVHAMHVFAGELHVTTWPHGRVAALQADGSWRDCGRLGRSTEANALNVHNGSLYAGAIPFGDVYRYDDDQQWSLIKRFCPQEVIDGAEPGKPIEWGRVTSLTSYAGRQFASIGSYTSSILDAPPDLRGRVFAMRTGCAASTSHDIGDGWRTVTAVRRGNQLSLYIDGRQCAVADASQFDGDLSSPAPIRIGFGPTAHFVGRIRDVAIWTAALDDAEVRQLATMNAST